MILRLQVEPCLSVSLPREEEHICKNRGYLSLIFDLLHITNVNNNAIISTLMCDGIQKHLLHNWNVKVLLNFLKNIWRSFSRFYCVLKYTKNYEPKN